jgi:hypothetical protein
VISDSIPWREELLRVADRLEQKKTQRRWTERSSFLVERDVMVSAYAIRKLLEARRLSDDLVAQPLKVRRHSLVGRPPDIWDRHEIWESFDLERGEEVSLSLKVFCNQIIHSWVWMLSATADDMYWDGIYVSSDFERRRWLYFIDVNVLVAIFRAVGSEDIELIQFGRDANGDMQVIHVVASKRSDSSATE